MTPRMKYLWRKGYSMTMGSVVTTIEAALTVSGVRDMVVLHGGRYVHHAVGSLEKDLAKDHLQHQPLSGSVV